MQSNLYIQAYARLYALLINEQNKAALYTQHSDLLCKGAL